MADQVPYVPVGLEQSVDTFIITQLRELVKFYRDQQGQPLEDGVVVKAIYSKSEKTTYPVIALLTQIDSYEPIAVGDFLEWNNDGAQSFTILMADINLHLEAREMWELARLRNFLYVNLDKGRHPLNGLPWLQFFINNGIEILSWENGMPQRAVAHTVDQRTARAQGPEIEERTDVEWIWAQECCIHVRTQLAMQFESEQGVITNVSFVFQITS